MMPKVLRTVMWAAVHAADAEHCTLYQIADGYRLEGRVVADADGLPHYVHYAVDCDTNWHTRTVAIDQMYGATQSTLRLEVDDEQRWTANGVEAPELLGLIDIDLSVTPATNTLPIRRLALANGQPAAIVAAWVRFPALSVAPLDQTYERISATRYRYTSGDGRYTARVDVDDLGLVVEYENAWVRIAEG
jgi:uncharacterized protein